MNSRRVFLPFASVLAPSTRDGMVGGCVSVVLFVIVTTCFRYFLLSTIQEPFFFRFVFFSLCLLFFIFQSFLWVQYSTELCSALHHFLSCVLCCVCHHRVQVSYRTRACVCLCYCASVCECAVSVSCVYGWVSSSFSSSSFSFSSFFFFSSSSSSSFSSKVV